MKIIGRVPEADPRQFMGLARNDAIIRQFHPEIDGGGEESGADDSSDDSHSDSYDYSSIGTDDEGDDFVIEEYFVEQY